MNLKRDGCSMFIPDLEVTLQYQSYVQKVNRDILLRTYIVVAPVGFYLYHECGMPLQPTAERYRRIILPYRRNQEMSVGYVDSDGYYESYCTEEGE